MHHQRLNTPTSEAQSFLLSLSVYIIIICAAEGFGILHQPTIKWGRSITSPTRLNIYAPPGSGYASLDDEQSALPATYEPMMEYPGTMRPGRTPENMPFQDLPIGDNDPDPVPWPHFQQIEWHHRWDAPHEHPIPMEEFIELQGRWATPEMEAAMRVGVRKSVRESRELEESEKRGNIITDDDEDDDVADIPVALGDGIFGQLGSSADQAATAAATSPNRKEDEADDEEFDDSFDDFLFDLGLDAELEDDASSSSKSSTKTIAATRSDDVDDDDDDDDDDSIGITSKSGGVTASIDVDDDSDLDLGLDDDDDLDGADTVPLEDFGDSDTLDTEDIFDEGGFDFDDSDFDMDGGDTW